jgi:hypothetical protein
LWETYALGDQRNPEFDNLPVYRTEAGTGGGWAFTRWL